MLKIIDGVDLKELEKFGFIKRYCDEGEAYSSGDEFTDIDILIENRKIYVSTCTELYECYIHGEWLDILFNLIQAGLVEKAGDSDDGEI